MMNRNCLLLCCFSITACFLGGIDTHEAIVGGEVARFPRLQYHVTILIGDHLPRCGAGILNEYFVLTAANCIVVPDGPLISKNISILAGTYDLRVTGVIVDVERVIIPREYDPRVLFSAGDIAILKLKTALPLITRQLIRLQLPRNRTKSYVNRDTVKIAGFGWDRFFLNNKVVGDDNTGDMLKYANVQVISNDVCQRLYPHRRITDKHLCARVKQFNNHTIHPRGVCIGDEGGSLVDSSIHEHLAIGVLSVITSNCSEATSAAIYIRVTHYLHIISYAMSNLTNHASPLMYSFTV